jgi:hypothetical protein
MPSMEAARIVVNTITVDPPLPATTRHLTATATAVEMRFASATGPRPLRVAVHATLEQVELILRTMDAFQATAPQAKVRASPAMAAQQPPPGTIPPMS